MINKQILLEHPLWLQIPAFQNFLALGSFASQLKTTIQATDSGLEKACTAQAHLASQVQAYLNTQ